MTSARVVHPQSGLPIGPEIEASPAQRPSRETLVGGYVSVVPLDPAAHADVLYENSHGADKDRLWLYLGDGPFPDRTAFRSWLERRASQDDPLFFTIIAGPEKCPAGLAAYMRITPEHRVIEIGNILFTHTLARTPGGTEAMYLMARRALEDLGYRRYEWKCNALNAASRQAALRLGFIFEGIFPQHMIQKGRSRDTAWFSMLDSEWPSCKTAFEQWLSPDNFDAEGKQRSRLAALRKGTDDKLRTDKVVVSPFGGDPLLALRRTSPNTHR